MWNSTDFGRDHIIILQYLWNKYLLHGFQRWYEHCIFIKMVQWRQNIKCISSCKILVEAFYRCSGACIFSMVSSLGWGMEYTMSADSECNLTAIVPLDVVTCWDTYSTIFIGHFSCCLMCESRSEAATQQFFFKSCWLEFAHAACSCTVVSESCSLFSLSLNNRNNSIFS